MVCGLYSYFLTSQKDKRHKTRERLNAQADWFQRRRYDSTRKFTAGPGSICNLVRRMDRKTLISHRQYAVMRAVSLRNWMEISKASELSKLIGASQLRINSARDRPGKVITIATLAVQAMAKLKLKTSTNRASRTTAGDTGVDSDNSVAGSCSAPNRMAMLDAAMIGAMTRKIPSFPTSTEAM